VALFLTPPGVVALGAVLGACLFVAPGVAWALLAALLGVVCLTAPPYLWVIAAVLAAVLSRVVVSTGFFPSLLNFFHFPLVLGAVLASLLSDGRRLRVSRPLAYGSVALLVVALLSSLLNGGELIRPLFTWLVFIEPFLLIYAVVRTPPPPTKSRLLWMSVVFLAIVQLPFGIWQLVTLGWADHVQGSFVGMGAGHHVAGAVALVGALIAVARALSMTRWTSFIGWLVVAVSLFLVPIFSDAKQTVVAFLPALLAMPVMLNRARFGKSMAAAFLMAPLIVAAFFYYAPLRAAVDWEVTVDGIGGKVEALHIIVHRGFEGPFHWIVGAGPGSSVSRVALMGLDGYLQSSSPVARLGLRPAALAEEISAMTTSNWRFASSSAWSGISSWLGLFGDLGLLGVAVYLWLCWTLWRSQRVQSTWMGSMGRAMLLMVGLLGAIYSWLEEPGFTLVVALAVAASILEAERARVLQHDRVPSTRRLSVDSRAFSPAGGGVAPPQSI
jgi:hypothetical protein